MGAIADLSGDHDYASGAADALELARVVSSLPDGRELIERLALEVGFLSSPNEIIKSEETSMAFMTRNGRAVKALQTAEEGHQYAVTGAEQARREVGKWEAAIVEAGERVDRARCDVLRDHAGELRKRSEGLRAEAARAGDATEDVPLTSYSPAMGSRTTLVRRSVSERLSAEAVGLTARAEQLTAESAGFERAMNELATLEREQPFDEAQVARRRLGVEGLRAGLADQVQRILEEGD